VISFESNEVAGEAQRFEFGGGKRLARGEAHGQPVRIERKYGAQGAEGKPFSGGLAGMRKGTA
jgi:hypothetical protein